MTQSARRAFDGSAGPKIIYQHRQAGGAMRITVRLAADLATQLEDLARASGATRTAVVLRALRLGIVRARKAMVRM